MILARFRRSSRTVAALLLLLAAFGLPHRAEADDRCAPSGVEQHDESKHVFTTVTGTDHQQHCAVCHWLRWMKPVFSATRLSTVQQDGGTDLIVYAAQRLRDPSSDQLPARAPPSSRL